MRTVFSNAQCAHVWAQQTQPHGRGPSVKFDRETFYSYQTPIARIVRDALGRTVALCTSERYSVTTEGKHKAHVRRALRGDMPVFECPDLFPEGVSAAGFYGRGMSRFPSHPNADHSGNVAYYLKEYSDAKAQLMRCPAESWRLADRDDSDDSETDTTPTRAHSTLRGHAVAFTRYSEAFKLGLAAPDWSADAAEVIARRDKLLNDPKRAAKREKAAAQRSARALAQRAALGLPADASNWQVKNAERNARWEKERAERAERDRVRVAEFPQRLAAWRAGTLGTASLDVPHDQRGAYLRVTADGATVQTSLGAEAPVSHVRPALAFYLRTVRDGLVYAYDASAAAVRLGHFKLDSIDSAGNVRAGCHEIAAAEVSALVATLQANTNSDAR